MTRAALPPALALLVSFAAQPAALGNPLDAYGFGARAPALGGAQTAATRDGGANYYNPAALALGNDIRIDLGYQIAEPFLRLNGGAQDVDESRGLSGAIAVPGRVLGVPVAIGAAVFLPDQRLTRTRSFATGVPRWALYDNRPQRLFLASNLAVRVTPTLWLGGGIAYMSRTEGTLDLTGRVGFPDADDSELALAIDVELKTVRYPQAGLLWRARPWLDLGASFRGEFVLSLDQAFTIRGDVGPAAGAPIVEDGYFALRSLALDLFQPQAWSAGFAARLRSGLLLAGDVTWQRWSRFDNPSAKIELELDLGPFNDMVMIPAPRPLPLAHFHDIVVPRLGVEWRAANTRHVSWDVRAGWAWEPSPAPRQQGESNFVDNDKHTFSLGLGAAIAQVTEVLPRPFSLDVYTAITLLPARRHDKLSAVDPVGDYASRGWVLQLGVASRWSF